METHWIWQDGDMIEGERAQVPFLTPALHYGIGVFEGIRCYDTARGPAVFRLVDHAVRLLRSARCLGFLELPWSVQDVIEAVEQTISRNGLRACYVRPLLWLADDGWNLCIDRGRARLGVAAWAWDDYHGDPDNAGIRAAVSSFTRHHPNQTATKAKICGNYVNSVLAKTEAMRNGFDEAIMLDPTGNVAECTGANLFVVKGGRLYTPPSATVLEGITRDSVMVLAADLGLEVFEATLTRDQLWIADEVFACGTAAECTAIREIDRRPIGDGSVGPITRRLQQAYREVVHGTGLRSARWCHLLPSDSAPRLVG